MANGLLLTVVGLAALIAGAEFLVRGASRLATAAGVSPLVVGLTIVAFGTSSPEMAAGAGAALHGSADLALGNVIGSNIFNVLVILGIGAVVAPLGVASRLLRIDVPLVAAVSFGVFALALDRRFSRVDGALLVGTLVVYTAWLIIAARREKPAGSPRPPSAEGPLDGSLAAVIMAITGLGALLLGAEWLVDGATRIAATAGVSERVIGLTVVAGGTSMPELATTIVASLRGERDIAVGNVVGSNLFNLTAVLGSAALLAPHGMAVSDRALAVDLPVMLATIALSLPVMLTGFEISRAEGLAFLAAFAGYTAWVVIDAFERRPPIIVSVAAGAVGMTALVLMALAVWRQCTRARAAQ
jgi:cation:H+ antiporter